MAEIPVSAASMFQEISQICTLRKLSENLRSGFHSELKSATQYSVQARNFIATYRAAYLQLQLVCGYSRNCRQTQRPLKDVSFKK